MIISRENKLFYDRELANGLLNQPLDRPITTYIDGEKMPVIVRAKEGNGTDTTFYVASDYKNGPFSYTSILNNNRWTLKK